MTAAVPSTIPLLFMAGDQVKFTQAFADYLPVDSWVVYFVLVNQTVRYTYTGTDNGDGQHLITISSAASSALAAGSYKVFIYAEKASERVTLVEATLEIKANFDSPGYDPRSHAKRTLDAIEAVIEQRAQESDKQVSINGRLLIHLDPSELLMLRDKYKVEYSQEVKEGKIAQGIAHKGKIRVRFTG